MEERLAHGFMEERLAHALEQGGVTAPPARAEWLELAASVSPER